MTTHGIRSPKYMITYCIMDPRDTMGSKDPARPYVPCTLGILVPEYPLVSA